MDFSGCSALFSMICVSSIFLCSMVELRSIFSNPTDLPEFLLSTTESQSNPDLFLAVMLSGKPSRFQSIFPLDLVFLLLFSLAISLKPLNSSRFFSICAVLLSASILKGGLNTTLSYCLFSVWLALTSQPQLAQNLSPGFNSFPQLVQNIFFPPLR